MNLLYVNNNDLTGNNVTAFRVDPQTGRLAPISVGPLPTDGVGWKIPAEGGRSIAQWKNNFLFLANQGDDTITSFRIDGNTGRLKPTFRIDRNTGQAVASHLVPAGVELGEWACLAVNPAIPSGAPGILYMGGRNGLSTFRIDPTSGTLTLAARLEFDPTTGMAMSPDGEFLAVSTVVTQVGPLAYNPGPDEWKKYRLTVFRLGHTGCLHGFAALDWATLAERFRRHPTPAGVEWRPVAPNTSLIFVGSNEQDSTRVGVFSLDRQTGALTPWLQSPFSFNVGSGSSHLRLSHQGDVLFVGNTFSRSVTILAVDPVAATLTLVQNIPVVSNSPEQVHTLTALERDDTGRFLFTANGGLDVGVLEFQAGQLTPIPGSAFATGNVNPGALQSGLAFVNT